MSDSARGSVIPQTAFDWECQKCSSHCFGCVIQAESELTAQTTVFEDVGVEPVISAVNPYVSMEEDDPMTSADLADFLKRPVRIYEAAWDETEPVGEKDTLAPWAMYLTNSTIKHKLQNYGFIKGKLHVKAVINASPFYYGALLMNYTPMEAYHGRIPSGALAQIPESQKMHTMIYPQENTSATMILPFYYNKNYLDLTELDDIEDFGTLGLWIYAALRSANGAVGVGVSIQFYAWMEEVTLAGPTLKFALQAKDEYGNGPVSGPASTLARLAGMLRGAPVIGSFATATEIAARAVSGIAQIFGFSNVPVIDTVTPVNLLTAPQLASSQIGHNVQKLCFDPKTELTVDNAAIGFDSSDELTILNFATRSSYLTRVTWTATTVIDELLFSSRVTPDMYAGLPTAGADQLAFTPSGLVCRMLQYWRGDLIFTFKVVASPYHRGRLRVAYDPVDSGVQVAGDVGPMIANAIYDLSSEEKEFEFRVPYSQATSWLENRDALGTNNWSTTGSLTQDPKYYNGILTLSVLTLLTAPIASSDVDILVFVRPADNIEFAAPRSIEPLLSSFDVQAQNEATTEGALCAIGGDVTDINSARNRVYMGEQVRTLRHLLRRYSRIDSTGAATTQGCVYGLMSRFPPFFGYDLTGINLARNAANTANAPFNWVKNNPYHLLSQCFLGQRGSTHWTITSRAGTVAELNAMRSSEGTTATAYPWPVLAFGTPYTNSNPRILWDRKSQSAGGALANCSTSNALNIGSPDYSGHKFRSTAAKMGTTWTDDPASHDGIRIECDHPTAGSNLSLHRYFAVGTDFNFVHFMYVPIWYLYDTQPAVAV